MTVIFGGLEATTRSAPSIPKWRSSFRSARADRPQRFAAGWLVGDLAEAPAPGSAASSSASPLSPDGSRLHGPLRGADDTPSNRVLAFRQALLLPAGLTRTCAVADALDAFTLEEFPAILALATQPFHPRSSKGAIAELRGARASRVLVSASRRNELPSGLACECANAFGEAAGRKFAKAGRVRSPEHPAPRPL